MSSSRRPLRSQPEEAAVIPAQQRRPQVIRPLSPTYSDVALSFMDQSLGLVTTAGTIEVMVIESSDRRPVS